MNKKVLMSESPSRYIRRVSVLGGVRSGYDREKGRQAAAPLDSGLNQLLGTLTPAPAAAFVDAATSANAAAALDTATATRLGNSRSVRGSREKHCYRRRCDNRTLSTSRQELPAIIVGVIF